jgi:hypothetical protein
LCLSRLSEVVSGGVSVIAAILGRDATSSRGHRVACSSTVDP